MTRIAGVLILLASLYGMLFAMDFDNATKWDSFKDTLNRQAYFGIITLGVGVLIIAGGIDLSIGSVIGLSAVLFCVLCESGTPPLVAGPLVLLTGAVIGMLHATLITKLKLQPFLVTLCGLFVYRGLARLLSPGKTVGLGMIRDEATKAGNDFDGQLQFLRETLVGKNLESDFHFPMMLVVLLVLFALVSVLLHFSVWGRYWYAIGHNEQAAKYAGIRVDRNKFAVYVLCSTMASLGGILILLDDGSGAPESMGEGWELYAITGAVLGGCSLRGGEGSAPGMIFGAAVLPLLKKLINFIPTDTWVVSKLKSIDPLVPALIGLTLLVGTIADEYFRRRTKR